MWKKRLHCQGCKNHNPIANFRLLHDADVCCRMHARNAELAQERVHIYAREAAKRAAEAQSAMEVVRWTQAAVEAARFAVVSSEKKEEELVQDAKRRAAEEVESAAAAMNDEAAEAIEVASQAMHAAAAAEDEAEQAKARRDEMDKEGFINQMEADNEADAGAYG